MNIIYKFIWDLFTGTQFILLINNYFEKPTQFVPNYKMSLHDKNW